MSFAAVVERLRTLSNPYPGLRPFETSESHLFFGRDQQIADLVARLERHRFLAVVGMSGSGKSSLVRAGLIPALERGRVLEAGRRWRTVITRPGAAPLESLAAELARADLDPSPLKRSSYGLIDIAQQLGPDESLLVLVDQFEELFRYKDLSLASDEARRRRGLSASEAAEFVQLLLEAGRHPRPVYVVVTMRSDYLGDCAEFRDLPAALNDGQYLVPRMTRDQRKEAIEVPLGQATIAPSLVQRLLNDAGDEPDQLPVLQHALMRIWNHWRDADPEQRRRIELEDYAAIGGFENAIDRHAEEVLAAVDPAIAATIFKRLTARGRGDRERRDPATFDELCAICGEIGTDARARVLSVIDRFRLGDATFLTPREGAISGSTYIDITHESLIRQWSRLRDTWLAEEQQSAKAFLALLDRARTWEAGRGEPLSGLDFADAVRWDRQRNPTVAWAEHYAEAKDLELVLHFISAGKAHDRKLRLRKRGLWVAAPLAGVFALLSVFAVVQARNATRSAFEAQTARIMALEESARAMRSAGDELRAREQAEAQSFEAQEQREIAETLRIEAERLGIVSLSGRFAARSQFLQTSEPNLSPSVLLAVEALHRFPSEEAEQALRRAMSRSPRRVMQTASAASGFPKDAARRIAVSRDGQQIAVVRGDTTIEVIDATTGRELSRLQSPARVLDIVTRGPRTWVIATAEHRLLLVPGGEEIGGFATGSAIRGLAISRDLLKVASLEKDMVLLSDVRTLDHFALSGTERATAMAISPNGRRVAVAIDLSTPQLNDYRIMVFSDSGSRSFMFLLDGKAQSLAFSEDGLFLVSADGSGEIRVFYLWRETEAREPARITTGTPLVAVATNDDASVVTAAGEDGTIRVFETATRAEISRFTPECAEGPNATVAQRPGCGTAALAISRDGRVVFSGREDGRVDAFEARGAFDLARIAEEFPVTATAFGRDGHRLVVGSGHVEAARVRVFDAPDWEQTAQFNPPSPEVTAAALSADGRFVAIASNWFGGPWVYNIDRPQSPPAAMGGAQGMRAVALSGDGALVAATALAAGYMFERATAKPLPLSPSLLAHAIAFSLDGRFAAVGTGDLAGAAAILLRLPSAAESTRVALQRPVMFVAPSPDGRWLAISGLAQDPVVRMIHVPAKNVTWQHTGALDTLVAFSPDSRAIAVASADGTLRVFEVATGEELARMLPARRIHSLSFTDKGRYLLATSVTPAMASGSEVVVTRYPVRSEDLLTDACSRVTRNLTQAEWRQYVGAEVPYHATCANR